MKTTMWLAAVLLSGALSWVASSAMRPVRTVYADDDPGRPLPRHAEKDPLMVDGHPMRVSPPIIDGRLYPHDPSEKKVAGLHSFYVGGFHDGKLLGSVVVMVPVSIRLRGEQSSSDEAVEKRIAGIALGSLLPAYFARENPDGSYEADVYLGERKWLLDLLRDEGYFKRQKHAD